MLVTCAEIVDFFTNVLFQFQEMKVNMKMMVSNIPMIGLGGVIIVKPKTIAFCCSEKGSCQRYIIDVLIIHLFVNIKVHYFPK